MPEKKRLHYMQLCYRDFFSHTGVCALSTRFQQCWLWVIIAMYMDEDASIVRTEAVWLRYLDLTARQFDKFCDELETLDICPVDIDGDRVGFYSHRVEREMLSTIERLDHLASKQRSKRAGIAPVSGSTSDVPGTYEVVPSSIPSDTELDTEKSKSKKNIRGARAKKFIRPTEIEVQTYMESLGISVPTRVLESNKFIDHFEASGWRLKGGNPMKSWKASVRNWKRNIGKFGNNGTPQQTKSLVCSLHPDRPSEGSHMNTQYCGECLDKNVWLAA